MVETIVQEGMVVVPEGIYKAKLDKWGKVVSKDYENQETHEKQTKSFIDAIWRITEGAYKDKLVRDNFSLWVSSSSELGKFIEKFTGSIITPGEKIELDNLIGVQAQLTIEVEEKTTKTGGKFKVNKVKSRMKAQ